MVRANGWAETANLLHFQEASWKMAENCERADWMKAMFDELGAQFGLSSGRLSLN